VAHRREEVEKRLTEHGRARDRLAASLFDARSAAERISLRLDSVQSTARALEARIERARPALAQPADDGSQAQSKLNELEGELRRLEERIDAGLGAEVEECERERREAEAVATELEGAGRAKEAAVEAAERAVEDARAAATGASERAQALVKERAGLEATLERIDALRRIDGDGSGPVLADGVRADAGFEAALAGALGDRIRASVVEDLVRGARVIGEGRRALVKGGPSPTSSATAPTADAVRLLDHVHADADFRALIELVLANAWVVDRIDSVPTDFTGIAVTRAGVSYHGTLRELRGAADGASLSDRGRRDEIAAELRRVSAELEAAQAAAEEAERGTKDSRERLEQFEQELREVRRRREEALERSRRAAWLVEQRRENASAPDDLRRRELQAEIAAERMLAENFARDRAQQEARRERLRARLSRDEALLPVALRLAAALAEARDATAGRVTELQAALEADEAVGEQAAAELRTLAQSEYDLQARLREAGEQLTQQEVLVAQVRDREQATAAELTQIEQRIGCEVEAEELDEEQRAEIEAKLERIERRRERIGPVNPLAEQEYREALEHVEELEAQRTDLEQALAELQGLIKETDKRIRESFHETFEIAARNFEEMVQQLFPGGTGRLRLVQPQGPRVVLGGADADEEQEAKEQASPFGDAVGVEVDDAPPPVDPKEHTPGIEIEVTPAGKATKRLSLLSGGEKSLVALSFLFAVFLARPCPFYILDEVEAALDDRNIDRFLDLVRRFADRSQFIVITHQRRTMEAADVLYGVSMGKDGISKVVSRRLESEGTEPQTEERLTEAA
jgi:chromosome segregation protein